MFCISKEYKNTYEDPISEGNNNDEVISGSLKKYKVCHSADIGVNDDENYPIASVGSGTPTYMKSYESTPYYDYSSLSSQDYPYAGKISFSDRDKYLVGKCTCGAYMFLNPSRYSDISVIGNTPYTAGRELTNKISINIPLVFQFRCTDYPVVSSKNGNGYIGGYSPNETLTNVSYTKKLGFDIYQKHRKGNFYAFDDVFYFDVKITGKYTRDGEIPQ